METTLTIPKPYLFIINQLFEMELKIMKLHETNSIHRNIDKLKDYFESEAFANGQGLIFHNPLGESYTVTRTDCEATITGTNHENLEIIEVFKPIIYFKQNNTNIVVQKAIVIVQSTNK